MAIILVFLFFLNLQLELDDDVTTIKHKLNNQAICWNAGNIDCFMKDYWKHDSLIYIGKNGVRYGWTNTLSNYKKRYPTKEEMGKLTFKIIKLKKLGDSHYYMVGKWQLTRKIGNVEGHFSLIWEKLNSDWVIIADHSS